MCRSCSAKLCGKLRANDNARHWLYSKWLGIKSRCYNKKQIKDYKYYGELGIVMHGPWKDDFRMFAAYVENVLGLPLNPYLTLDRIDPNESYKPCNLRWATYAEQKANSRDKFILRLKRMYGAGRSL